jgi:hypothetical protein
MILQNRTYRYWCPTCNAPVATALIRIVYTGPSGETVRNHRGYVNLHGAMVLVDHTVITRQAGAVAA